MPDGSAHSVREPRLGYSPAIDGFRAIAVLAVVAYHFDLGWAAGGYLGVEVFFVISGFLITALMLAEHQRTGRVDLANFWLRRARRLLPALYLLIIALVAFMAIGPSAELVDIRDDVLAALTYVTNWFLSFSDQSYFEALGRPSPLRHLWSLAVEEQWYLIWPLVFAGGLWASRGNARRLVVPMAVGVVASTALMWGLYDPDADPSRIYFGTDTRAAGLLLGSLLAVVSPPWRMTDRVGPRAPAVMDAAAAAALGFLAVMFWRLDELSPFLYRGGFLMTGLLTSVVIFVVVHPAAALMPKLLAAKPLVWVGLRSYGLYLWHWPIIVFTRPRLDTTLDGWQLHGLRLALALVLTELSFTYVETPIRNGALGRAWHRFREAGAAGAKPAVTVAAAASILIAGLTLALVRAEPATVEAATTDDVADLINRASTTTSMPSTTAAAPSTTAGQQQPTSTTTSTTQPTTTTEARLPRSVAVTGDSVGITMAINFPSDLNSIVVDNAGVEGCGVIEDGVLKSNGRTIRNLEACTDLPERWARGAEGNELTLVTIGAWEVFDLVVDGREIAFGSPDHDALVIAGLKAGIDALLETGTEVAVMEIPCWSPVDGGGLVALPERGDRQRTQHLTELIRQVAGTYPSDVAVVAPPTEFCTDESVGDDVNLRWDGVHYGPLGGAFIWARIEQALLEVPVDY